MSYGILIKQEQSSSLERLATQQTGPGPEPTALHDPYRCNRVIRVKLFGS
jgi:hypothetical protein